MTTTTTTTTSNKPFKRILLTGAAGGLGRILRDHVKAWADVVRVTDIADLGAAREGEEIVLCDLADKAAVLALMDGVEVVMHFGGISTEHVFEDIVQANIIGTYNLYEAVHKCGIKRVVYASSSHTVGYYETTEVVDADVPFRPDTLYAVSKCFGESLSRYYYDRLGIETVCLRIGSSFPEPTNRRFMVTWLSYEDLFELVRCALFTPRVGHTIAYGVSDNPSKWWNNGKASHLGFHPRDSSARFAGRLPDSGDYPAHDDITAQYQGGPFLLHGPKYREA